MARPRQLLTVILGLGWTLGVAEIVRTTVPGTDYTAAAFILGAVWALGAYAAIEYLPDYDHIGQEV